MSITEVWERDSLYSAFLAFLLRVPSLSSSLVLMGEAGTAGAWWSWWSSEARGEPKSRWHTQPSTRANGEPWECLAVMNTWDTKTRNSASLRTVLMKHFGKISNYYIYGEVLRRFLYGCL